RPRPRQSELPLRHRARSCAAAPARAWRACADRARDARCARARHLVGARPFAEPCHECARAQHSRRARRHCRRSVDAAFRPGRARVHPASRHLGLAARHPPADAARTRAPAVLVLGVLLTAGCPAALPRSPAWPRPVVLGGVIGDWMLRLPAMLAGGTLAGPVRVAVAVVAGAGMLLCFAVAAGFGWRAAGGGDAEAPVKEDEARGMIPLGWITHGFLSLKARLTRALTRRPSAPARPDLPAHGRIDPRFDGSARATLQPSIAPEADDEDAAIPQAAPTPKA